MANQITPNPSVPSQVVSEVKFPQVIQNLGIIPTSYKDSMSYYETLAWLCKYLEETVIPSVNQNGNAVQELQNLYINLNSYVDHYFDNLDVQNEINNKLDEMARVGELQSLLNNLYDQLETDVNNKISRQNNSISNIENTVNNINQKVNSVANINPLVVDSIDKMTDTSKIYVNTSNGNWYFYNGESWKIGGIYQSRGISNDSISINNFNNNLKNIVKTRIPLKIEKSGFFITSAGKIVENIEFCYTEPILLNAGEKIHLRAAGYLSNVAIFSKVDLENNIEKVLKLSNTSAISDYEYVNMSNKVEYISVSYKINTFEELYIEKLNYNDKIQIDSFSNLITDENLKYLKFSCNTEIIDNNSKIYNKILKLSITPSDVFYTFSFYYFKKIDCSKISNIKKIIGFIDIKGKTPENKDLKFKIGKSQGGNFSSIDAKLQIKSIFPNENDFTRYYIEIDNISESISELTIGILSNTKNEEILEYEIKSIGLIFNDSIENATSDFLTLKDKNSIYERLQTKTNTYKNELFSSFLNFGVIGDSLASGESVALVNGQNRYIDNYDYSWGQFIARKYGMKCINFSTGGLTTRSWLTSTVGLTKLLKEENKCNSYIIALGVNDVRLGSEYVGNINDINVNNYNLNNDTYYGNYGKIISNIKNIQPKAKIFLLTIPKQNQSQNYSIYNTAIKEIANLFSNCYVIDLANNYSDFYDSGFLNNNLRVGHYNAMGYNYMSSLLYNALSEYMYENQNEFNQIEFIGTNYSY